MMQRLADFFASDSSLGGGGGVQAICRALFHRLCAPRFFAPDIPPFFVKRDFYTFINLNLTLPEEVSNL